MVNLVHLTHILRRDLTTTSPAFIDSPDGNGNGNDNDNNDDAHNPLRAIFAANPAWLLLLIFFVDSIIILAILSIRYTLMGVVATIAQIETPTSAIVSLEPTDDAGAPLNRDAEMVSVPIAPVTASIRGTLRHLTTIGGFTARWRGIAAAVCTSIVYSILHQILANVLSTFLPFFLASVVSGVLATIALARWYLAWTHIVISEPSSKRWTRRIPSFASWRKIWAPTAINATVHQLALLVPLAAFYAFGFGDMTPEKLQKGGLAGSHIAGKLLALSLMELAMYLFIVVPVEVALTRCQASLLPDEDETIVPMDRSFGGKVVPEIVGGSGMVSFRDAFKSFDRPARLRLFKLYLKFFAIDVALQLAFGMVLGVQLVSLISRAQKHDSDA